MHKLGSRRELGFASFRKDTLKLAAEISGAAYRIRTYDPRITKVIVSVRKYEENHGFGAESGRSNTVHQVGSQSGVWP